MDIERTTVAGHPVDIRELQARQASRPIAGAMAADAAHRVSFAEVFAKKVEGLRFSAHAESR
ncbi:MAG: hypothetical protein JXA71_05345, partial [Chitinispirillaceae bacterium]|nr:hypothetical protein [Chitinispirillaceae bacterium]